MFAICHALLFLIYIFIKIIIILTGQHKLIFISKESFLFVIITLYIYSVTLLLTAIKIGHTKLYKSPKQTFTLSLQHTVWHIYSRPHFDDPPHPIIYNSAFPRHTTAAVLRRFYYSWEGRSQVSRLCLSIAGEKSKRALWVTEAACQAGQCSSNSAREWIAEAAGASDTHIISTGRWPMSTFHGTDWGKRSSIWIPD